jgi:putative flavoprotein involved in K+ transport
VGLRPVLLDRSDRVGASWAGRYARLCLHTVRPYSGLAHYPLPWRYPWYVPKDLYARYLADYAARFDLDVRLGCAVRAIQPADDKRTASWEVHTIGGTWRCRVVVVALGQFGLPVMPDWPGKETFGGRLLHSSEYVAGRAYAGQRVLVIGAGNSGTEIAADLAEQGAAYVAISIRTPPPIVPRDVLGFPVQVFGILVTPLPARAADWIGRRLARLALGDLTRYGVGSPAWAPFSQRRVPTIDVGLVHQLKRGRVQVRPGVVGFTPAGVRYGDGREEAFDTVVAATGFASGLPRLLRAPAALDHRGLPRFRSGRPTAYPGLYFMGYTDSLRGHLFEANRDSRRLARLIAGYLARGGTRLHDRVAA